MNCSIYDCEAAAKDGGLCWRHLKRRTRGVPLDGAITKRSTTGLERLREAALSYAEAEDDDDYRKADDSLRKSALAYSARNPPQREGRPSKIKPDEAAKAVTEIGSAKRAAVALEVSLRTIRRALKKYRAGDKSTSVTM